MRSGSSKDSGNAEAPGRSEVRPRNRRPVRWWSQAMTMLNWRGSGAGQLTPLISPLWRCGAGVASVRPSRSVRDRLFFGLVSSITTAIARSSSCPETARRYVIHSLRLCPGSGMPLSISTCPNPAALAGRWTCRRCTLLARPFLSPARPFSTSTSSRGSQVFRGVRKQLAPDRGGVPVSHRLKVIVTPVARAKLTCIRSHEGTQSTMRLRWRER
jgi:hypothetical protein